MAARCGTRVWTAAVVMLAVALGAWAQAGQSGGIAGQITDQNGGAVAGATVTLTDTATGETRSVSTNGAGRFVFANLSAGQFNVDITKSGFEPMRVVGQEVVLGNTTTVNAQLRVGAATQTVEVTSTAGAELQTTNSSMGTAIAGDELQNMPNVGAYRDVSNLVEYQANSTSGGQIGGAVNDQNSFMLDGGNASDDTTGTPNYDTAFSSGGSGVIPTPVESVEEMRVTTNNAGADFNGSSGGEIQLETKRGTAQWHGAAYDFFQSSVLDANTWANDRTGSPKQKTHQNRFGGAIGGPISPLGNALGGKSFFFVNYEGRIFPQAATDDSSVPTTNLENGIFTFKDNAGNIDTWALNGVACAKTTTDPSGACDPRNLGIDPLIQKIWQTYMPTGNNPSGGDGLNTIGYLGQISDPTHDNFVVGRFDHDFGSNWHLTVSDRWYDLVSPDPSAQTDFGGVLPGDTKGVYTNAANRPQQPGYFVAGLTGTLSPSVTNQFHFNYVRNWWQWQSSPLAPEPVSGFDIPANIEQTIEPINVNAQSVRERYWYGHDWNYSDDMDWIHGNHLIAIGGTYSHKWMHFSRDDNGLTIDTSLTYNIGDFLDTDVTFPSSGSAINYLPPICATGTSSNCLPSGSETSYEQLYSELIGAVDTSGQIFVRSGSNLQLQPQGTNATDFVRVDSNYVYITDTWHIRPSLTLSYGLNYGVQLPPYEENGDQTVPVDLTGNPIYATQYLAQRQSAALQGEVYNPTIGWNQVRDIGSGLKYPFNVDYSDIAPRFAVAWSPTFHGGLLASLFGQNAGVLRGGYARVYDRENGVDLVFTPLLGDNFLQPTTCSGLTTAGSCLGISNANVTPATAFRLGVDGNVVPLGNVPATEAEPVFPGLGAANGTPPGANAAPAGDIQSLDPGLLTPYADEFNLSFQRQLPGKTILEVSYTFHRGEQDLVRENLDAVPYMMTLGGESFASAYAYLEEQYRAGAAVGNLTPQPFFEQALGGTSSAFCKGFASCTAAVYSNEATLLKNVEVVGLWDALDEPQSKLAGQIPFVFGDDLASTTQFTSFGTISSVGWLNYNSGAISLNKRTAHGLTIDTNLTWAREFTNYGAEAQLNTSVDPFNPYDLQDNKAPVTTLPRFTYNLIGNWQLPYGSSGKGLSRAVLGGWSLAPVFTWNSGVPVPVTFGASGATAAGGGQAGDVDVSPTAIMTAPESVILNGQSPTQYLGVLGGNGVGTNETTGSGTQVGYFLNPSAIVQTGGASGFTSADFRPYILGLDGDGYGAYLPGLHAWQMHLSALKDISLTEKLGATISAQALNLFNHAQYPNPTLNLASLASFGDIGAATSGRVIEMGLRLHW